MLQVVDKAAMENPSGSCSVRLAAWLPRGWKCQWPGLLLEWAASYVLSRYASETEDSQEQLEDRHEGKSTCKCISTYLRSQFIH
jgi:hypothetical protein